MWFANSHNSEWFWQLLHDWLEEKKNDGAHLESSPNSICGATFIFCKVDIFPIFMMQSGFSKFQFQRLENPYFSHIFGYLVDLVTCIAVPELTFVGNT